MVKIKNLEMASAVSANNDIKITSAFCGFVENAVYLPTNSKVSAHTFDYAPDKGREMASVSAKTVDEIESYMKSGKVAESVAIGNVRAEVCMSKDKQFIIYQWFHFEDFHYKPMSKPISYSEHDAEIVSQMFGL